MSNRYTLLLTSILAIFFLTSGLAIPAQISNDEPYVSTQNYYFDLDNDKIDDAITSETQFPLWTFVHVADGFSTQEVAKAICALDSLDSQDSLDSDDAGQVTILRYVPVIVTKFDTYESVRQASELTAVSVIEMDRPIKFAMDVSIQAVKAAPSALYSSGTAHDLGFYGDGVTVAILDLGIDNEHELLEGSFVAGADFSRPESALYPRDGSYDPDDGNGHGTGVASVLASRGDINGDYVGIAPKAGVIDLKMSDLNPAYSRAMADAMEWCLDNQYTDWGGGKIGIDLISMSALTDTTPGSTIGQLQEQIAEAGIPFIQAAGNDGVQHGDQPATYWWSDDVIIAGGIDDLNTVTRADDVYWDQATYGPRQSDGDEDPYDELKPDVVAPAMNLTVAAHSENSGVTPASGYQQVGGTSYATPHVSGIVALMMEANPKIASLGGKNVLETIRQILHETAEARGEPYNPSLSDKYNEHYGYGIVDAYEAVLKAVELSIKNDPPEITSFKLSQKSVKPGGDVNVSVSASDPEGDTIFYDLTASGGEVAGTGPTWTWTAPQSEAIYVLKVTVSDGFGGENSRTEEVTVTNDPGPPPPPPPPGNQPPVISSFTASKLKIEPRETVELEVVALDPEDDDLDYDYTVTDGSISGSGEIVDYTAPNQDSFVSITANVSDGNGGYDDMTINIEVNSPPEVKLPPRVELVKLTPTSVIEGSSEEIKLKVTVKQNTDEIKTVYADLSDLGGSSKASLEYLYPQTDLGEGFLTYSLVISGLHKLKPNDYDIDVNCEDVSGRTAQAQTVVLTIEEDYSIPDIAESDDESILDFNASRSLWIGLFAIVILMVVIILVLRRNN